MQVSQFTSTFTITPPRTRGAAHTGQPVAGPPQPAHLLDTPEQRRYHIPRSTKYPQQNKEEPQNPGKPTRPHRVPCPFPNPQAMDRRPGFTAPTPLPPSSPSFPSNRESRGGVAREIASRVTRAFCSADRLTPIENRLERRPALQEISAAARG